MTRATSKRSITFNSTVKIVEIMSIYDYTPSEIDAAWYSDEDMERITEKCFKIIKKMSREGDASKRGCRYCTRGLEGYSTSGRISKKRNRRAAIAAVLEEQERQWYEDEDVDCQAIANAYRRITSSCQKWSQVMGNRDAKAVEIYLSEDDECERMLCATKTMYSHKFTSPAPLKSSFKNASHNAILSKSIDTSNLLTNYLDGFSPKEMSTRQLEDFESQRCLRSLPIPLHRRTSIHIDDFESQQCLQPLQKLFHRTSYITVTI